MNNETQQDEVEAPPIHVDTEAASTNFYWTVGNHEVFNLQTTVRGTLTAEQIAAHVASAIEAMRQVVKGGGHAKPVGYPQKTEAIATTTPAQAAIETGKAAPEPVQAPKPATQPAAQQNGKQPLTLIASKVQIEPQPDGRAKVSFFEAGHKYADIYSVKPPANWSGMLGWELDEFGKNQTFDNLAVKVVYTLSDKLNSKGNPYKDIVSITR